MEPEIREKRKFRDSVLLKMIVTGLLILALNIPLMMVRGQIWERQQRRDSVVNEVASTWGRAQTLGGPVLTVPYLVHSKDEKGKITTWTQLAHFLPESLKIDGELEPEMRRRAIFEVAVYRADLHGSGTFLRPSFTEWGIPAQDILWEKAWLSIGIPDMRGILRGVKLNWAGRALQLAPGGGVSGLWNTGLRVPITGLGQATEKQTFDFAFDLAIHGSETLSFLPFGKQNTVSLRSSWPDPSFSGGFLPESRSVTSQGFQATWSVPYFGRSYPQKWLDAAEAVPENALNESAFGVDLYLPVDIYQKTERSVKYGMLFLVLTFLAFFLFEVFSPISLHPMHYLLVGSALCLFYVLLLSISEHIPFGTSYAIASAGIIALIAGYSFTILGGRRRALAMSGMLVLLYSYLYILLQAEDYALLLGSIGLFVILGLVMYLTRKVDWYSPRMGKGAAEV
ncbi:MAG TPA: cell envelope integrity protein CreD [Thermoanaerobaculia bacterium]|nr:cell envelope integrity protein CreD [Thermoanaerobaculia bacterium]